MILGKVYGPDGDLYKQSTAMSKEYDPNTRTVEEVRYTKTTYYNDKGIYNQTSILVLFILNV